MSTQQAKIPAEVFATLPQYVDAEKAKGITGTFQFELEGKHGGVWTVSLDEGKCMVSPQGVLNPDVTIKMTDRDFVDLANGKLAAVPAFITGKIKVYGDYNLAAKLQVLFNA